MFINQGFIPSWNAIYSNLIMKVAKSVIVANVYESPFSQMLQDMECGEYVEDIHINPAKTLLQDTVTNSDLFTNYTDDIATAVYDVTVDLVFASTYTEYVVRTSFNLIENIGQLITAITANTRTTLEIKRTNLVKQMLYNAYQYGMLSSVTISDPRVSDEASGEFAVALNNLIDDFRTEVNSRNLIYNNQITITTEAQKRKSITKEFPYTIVFNEFTRKVEFANAINLGLVGQYRSENNNQDWETRLIKLNLDDFPTSIPPTNRSEVVGSNVSADDINFFEMPTDENDVDLFNSIPTGGDTIVGFVIDPKAIKLFTQLAIHTTWLNPASLSQTNREIYRGIMALGAFDKICAVTCNEGV